MKLSVLLLPICCLVAGCGPSNGSKDLQQSSAEVPVASNSADSGFDLKNSDPKAVAIADQVMEAMGGREKWDKTRIITWNFLGIRTLVWDKWSGNVRIEVPDKELTILMNVHTSVGAVQKQGLELSQPDSIAKYVNRGKAIWINDSYWLVMPFKLKDGGVTLKYLGEELSDSGQMSDVLQLTFKNVGNTPDNRYKICVDQESKLVCQWEFFRHYENDSSEFVNPWLDYNEYGDILLSGNRGKRHLTDIMVYDSLPSSVFTSFDAVQLQEI